MAKTREELVRSLGSISDQGALVKKLTKKSIKPVSFQIPGGRTLTETLDKEGLKRACYNWLRRCREFSQATIWLTKQPDKYRMKITKIEEFPSDPRGPVWSIVAPDGSVSGKRWLSEKMGGLLYERDILAVQAKPDGLYIMEAGAGDPELTSDSEDWEPWVEIVPKRREEWT